LQASEAIAALPFQNRSDGPQQEYFADGIVDDINLGCRLY
jgi:TolB-like protein